MCGLALEVPLIVYAGSMAPERGLDAVVKALPALPDVHLALVAGRTNTSLSALLDLSRRLGVHDRVHVAPYVAPHAVPTYLASATLGVIPFLRKPNNEISLPTKLPEYLHAGLPVIVSDAKPWPSSSPSTASARCSPRATRIPLLRQSTVVSSVTLP